MSTDKPWLTDEYRQYLESDEWALVRASALARVGYRCARCLRTDGLQVHHLHYERLGREHPDDVIVLCAPCHDLIHTRQSSARLYDARLDGWARKRWGDDWGDRVELTEAQDAFDEWLERRG